jgi:dipeptidyl aminopeptidase/acylaminoacyl peptidase
LHESRSVENVWSLSVCLIAAIVPPATCASDSDAILSKADRLPNAAAPGEQVEFFWSKPAGDGPFPVLVLLHGHQGLGDRVGGKVYVKFGALDAFARSALVAVAISQPGYGASDGPADFCGPKTQAAVETVIGHFHRQRFVDPQRIAIDGTSRGAIVAAMLATKHPTLAAVVLTGGVYDLESLYRETCEGTLNSLTSMIPGSSCWSFEHQMRLTDADFARRSALTAGRSIKVPILILHGLQDDRAPVAQARAFAAALEKSGAPVQRKLFDTGHRIPRALRAPVIGEFLTKYLGLREPLPEP